jgi:tetratricopeptide (TPR) repeat protein
VVEKRLTRRQIREDPLLVWSARAEAFAAENWQRLAIGAGAVALVVILIFVLRGARRGAELEASELLAQSQVQLWTGNYSEAGQLSQQVIERSPGTRSGRIAHLVRGEALLKTGDFDGALASYRTFLDREKRDSVMRVSAQRGVAVALEETGQFAAAADAYEELAREATHAPIIIQDLLSAGRCRDRAGDATRARALYKQIIDTYPKEVATSDAKLRLAELDLRSPAPATP